MNVHSRLTPAVPVQFITQANALHAEITGALLSALDKARELGLILMALKATVPPGQWEAFVTDNLTFKPRAARNYIRIAKEWGRLESGGAATIGGALRLLTGKPDGNEPEPVGPARHAEGEARHAVPLSLSALLTPVALDKGGEKRVVKITVPADVLEALTAIPADGLPANEDARRGEIIRRLLVNYVHETSGKG